MLSSCENANIFGCNEKAFPTNNLNWLDQVNYFLNYKCFQIKLCRFAVLVFKIFYQ